MQHTSFKHSASSSWIKLKRMINQHWISQKRSWYRTNRPHQQESVYRGTNCYSSTTVILEPYWIFSCHRTILLASSILYNKKAQRSYLHITIEHTFMVTHSQYSPVHSYTHCTVRTIFDLVSSTQNYEMFITLPQKYQPTSIYVCFDFH